MDKTIDIRVRMLTRRIKVKDIAKIADCSSAAVSQWINGKTKSGKISRIVERLLQEVG